MARTDFPGNPRRAAFPLLFHRRVVPSPREINMNVARNKARKSISESLGGRNPQQYVVPESEIRDLAANLRIGQARDVGMCLLVINLAARTTGAGQGESAELSLRLIRQIAEEDKCRPIQRLIKAIIAAFAQGAEGRFRASLTITRFLEFAFEFVPDQKNG